MSRSQEVTNGYREFSLRLLKERFGIAATDFGDLFSGVPPLPATAFFETLLQRHLPIVRGLGTEKVRSEMIIAPLLVEVREQSGQQIGIFSGAELSVDTAQGLYGFCDFLISHSPMLLAVTAPIVAMVEAKREDLTEGIPQCIAEMYAAALLNARDGEPGAVIYGAVTRLSKGANISVASGCPRLSLCLAGFDGSVLGVKDSLLICE